MGLRPVVCVGALHVDTKARVSGTVIPGTSNPALVSRSPGGVAGNVARTLAQLGVPVSIVSVVGDDEAGRGLVALVAAQGVGVDDVVVLPGEATAAYIAVLDGVGSLTLGIADMAIYDRLDRSVIGRAITRHGAGVIWCADANPAPDGLATLAAMGSPLFLDPVSVAKAPRLLPLLPGAAAVFPDAAEATALTGIADPESAAHSLLRTGVERVVVTLGADGVVVADASGVRRRPAVASGPVLDVTGAGDALLAGYLAAVPQGEEDPVGWGLAAASLAVETLETVPEDLDLERLRARLPS